MRVFKHTEFIEDIIDNNCTKFGRARAYIPKNIFDNFYLRLNLFQNINLNFTKKTIFYLRSYRLIKFIEDILNVTVPNLVELAHIF